MLYPLLYAHAFPPVWFQPRGRNLIPVSLGNTLGSNASAGFSGVLDFTNYNQKHIFEILTHFAAKIERPNILGVRILITYSISEG